MAEQKIACYRCKITWSFEPPMGRRDECPSCRTDARVCYNCLFYDPSSYRECREEQAEWVKEKNQGNFCGFFSPAGVAKAGEGEASTVKAKLDALFGSSQKQEAPKPGASLAGELARFIGAKKP